MLRALAKCAAVVWILTAFVAGQNSAKYTVVQRLSLTEKTDGVDGEVQLFLDARIADYVIRQMWDVGSSDFSLDENRSTLSRVALGAAGEAKLQIVDKHGTRIWNNTLALPLAKITALTVGTHRVFFLTVDESAGFVFDAGQTTTLFMVSSEGLRTIEAFDAVGQRNSPIVLTKTLKSDWKTIPTAVGSDVLAVFSSPNVDGYKYSRRHSGDPRDPLPEQFFDVHYIRYRFDGQQWFRYERVESGLWQKGQPFPPESSFPQ